MRPGRAGDLPALIALWRREVLAGRQDMVPNEETLRRMLARFDWEAQSRVVEEDGMIVGSVLVMSRPSVDGVLANVYAAGAPDVFKAMAGWGVRLSRAAGAAVAQVFVGKGMGDGLAEVGLKRIRPWWRMDRSMEGLPPRVPIDGYALEDATTVPPGAWEDMFNRTFADHWRFAARGEAEIVGGRPPNLCLMAVTAAGREPAGMTIGELDTFAGDARPQPVGLVSSVGTLPEHRRRGIATWLVVDILRRLHDAGARSASLYVDGKSPVRAYDVYRKIGFDVAAETEVWEATWP